jgi:glycosyltransferase involved in cell wall biosynthesis
MPDYPTLSVIVPTYNRSASLSRLLNCLDMQSYPVMYWEVIVVDDGSNDPGYSKAYDGKYQYKLVRVKQNHQGAVVARNAGAQHSQADIMVFLDDDVVVEPGYLEGLVREHNLHECAVIMGFFQPSRGEQAGTFKKAVLRSGVTQDSQTASQKVDFIHCVSHNLSIKRNHFFEIGMFQDPTYQKGWPNWDDIDLAYRADQHGFEFIQALDARGSHMDHVLEDFKAHCKRIYWAGVNANWLFKKYPELKEILPMFRDKTPIRLGVDSIGLVFRKILRIVLAWGPILHFMEAVSNFLEKYFPDSRILVALYRWINSSYIFRGYRFGLKSL